MLSNVVVGTSHLVDPRETLVTGVWHILLVKTPRDALVLEQVYDSRHVLGDLGKWVSIKAKVFATIQSENDKPVMTFEVTYPPTAAM